MYTPTSNMSIRISQKVTPLKCQRCHHFWNYKGKNRYVATCPHCRTYVTIKKHLVLPSLDSKPSKCADLIVESGKSFNNCHVYATVRMDVKIVIFAVISVLLVAAIYSSSVSVVYATYACSALEDGKTTYCTDSVKKKFYVCVKDKNGNWSCKDIMEAPATTAPSPELNDALQVATKDSQAANKITTNEANSPIPPPCPDKGPIPPDCTMKPPLK